MTALDDLGFRIWVAQMAAADDFGVVRRAPIVLKALDFGLSKRPDSEIDEYLDRMVASGLLLQFDHQGQPFLCDPFWQKYQTIRLPRKTYQPCPPSEILRKCCGETTELLRKYHEKFPKDFRSPRVRDRALAKAKAKARATATGESEGGESEGGDAVRAIVALWNAIVTPPIPQVQKLTSDRRTKIAARLQTFPDLETWRTVIRWLNAQPWCRASGTGTHGNWTATLDWLTKSDGNLQRQLEQAQTGAAPVSIARTRAAAFCARYRDELVPRFRDGAVYAVTEAMEATDLDAAERLCTAYADEQLDELAEVFLCLEDPFLQGKTRSITLLLVRATAMAERLAATGTDGEAGR